MKASDMDDREEGMGNRRGGWLGLQRRSNGNINFHLLQPANSHISLHSPLSIIEGLVPLTLHDIVVLLFESILSMWNGGGRGRGRTSSSSIRFGVHVRVCLLSAILPGTVAPTPCLITINRLQRSVHFHGCR